jgi:hypothetical protein
LNIYENSDTVVWTVLEYISPMERRALADFRKSMFKPQQADMDVFLSALAKKTDWEFPDIDTLKGERYRGMSELRWRSGGVQHRLLGYSPKIFEYLVLIGCTHKGPRYDPKDAMETARKRKKQIETKEATYAKYKLVVNG